MSSLVLRAQPGWPSEQQASAGVVVDASALEPAWQVAQRPARSDPITGPSQSGQRELAAAEGVEGSIKDHQLGAPEFTPDSPVSPLPS